MLLEGKKTLIPGVVNDRSIAYGIARPGREQGACTGFSDAAALLSRIEEKASLHRDITSYEVGNFALSLAFELSSGITGETLFVDSDHTIMGV